jgi:hypothetical protein
MSSLFCRLTTAAVASILLVGCETVTSPKPTPPVLSFTAADRPEFVVAYYPYGVCMPRHLAAPIPNYTNWTNGRMVRDLRRMQETGFSMVFVCLDSDRANDEFGLERSLQFLTEAERLGGPKVALLIGPGETPLRRDVMARRLLRARIHVAKQAVKEAERPVVFLRPGTQMMGNSHPAIMFQTLVAKDYVWVTAGQVQGQELVRDKGHTLRQGIWAAYRRHARNIVVTWNDFQSGNFVEPNSFDSSLRLNVVKEEVRRVASAVAGIARPSAGGEAER